MTHFPPHCAPRHQPHHRTSHASRSVIVRSRWLWLDSTRCALVQCYSGRFISNYLESATRTGIGCRFPATDKDGVINHWNSHRYSLEMRAEDFPWVFDNGRKPSPVISTLEALTVLVSLKRFYGDDPDEDRTRVYIVPPWTDNLGNGAALDKLMSTKFHAPDVLMELATY